MGKKGTVASQPLPKSNGYRKSSDQTPNLKKLAGLVEDAGIPQGTGPQEEDEIISFTLRIWKTLDQEIKAYFGQLPARKRPNRNEFICIAIEEKLRRDRKKIGK